MTPEGLSLDDTIIWLSDAAGDLIFEGDLVLDGRGKVFVVQPTENTFRKSTLLRVNELRGKRMTPKEEHTYLSTVRDKPFKVSREEVFRLEQQQLASLYRRKRGR